MTILLFSRTGLGFALLAAALATMQPALGQTVNSLGKQYVGVQTGPTATVDDVSNGGAWRFAASVSQNTTGTISFTPPGGAAQALPYDSSNGVYQFHQYFASQAAMNSAYPSGTYKLTFGGVTVPVSLAGDAYPSVPVVVASTGNWSGGILSVAPNQALTLTFNFGANFTAGKAHMKLNVVGGSYSNTVDSLSDLAESQMAMTIPANTLQSGITYTVTMDSDNISTLDTTSAPGATVAATYESETSFPLKLTAGVANTPPFFTTQPTGAIVATGSTAVLNVAATGTPTPAFQWNFKGTPIAGATSSRLVLSNVSAASGGTYNCIALNSAGSLSSIGAFLTVTTPSAPSRMGNISVLTQLQGVLTVGFVIGGSGTSGSEPLLIRGIGPALGAFGLTGLLPDPTISLFPPGATAPSASNAGWGSPAGNVAIIQTANAFTGAFALTNAASTDSAMVQTLASGAYTVQTQGKSGDSGNALTEVYDYTSSLTASSPRLSNISCRTTVAAGGTLTAGFVISGTTAKTVLVRATGPALAAFGIAGTMPDPKVAVFGSDPSTALVSNAGWKGDPQITAADSAVFAFALTNPASADSAVLLTLSPGSYTAQVASVSGAAGQALVEVYEVP